MVNIAELFEFKELTGADFRRIKNAGTNRICFTEANKNALAIYGGRFPYRFSIPFDKGIRQVFALTTGLKLFQSTSGIEGYWVGLENEAEKEVVQNWISAQGTKVYLLDLLDLSVCCSLNMTSNKKHTDIGELERKAKYNGDRAAIEELANRMSTMIGICPVLSKGAVVTAIPPRQGKGFDLPTELARLIASKVAKPLIVAGTWSSNKGQLKEIPFEEKWDTLDRVGFVPTAEAAQAKKVILIDDLYQSGSTLNFIGAKLKNANKGEVMGVCAVKSMRDTDNN